MQSSFIRDTRGAAMVEGVIVLPVFVIVFAALLYYHQAFSTKLERSNQARSCAWTYSIGGCVKVPEGCPIGFVGQGTFTTVEQGTNASDLANLRTSQSGMGEALGAANSLLTGLLGLSEAIEARPSSEVAMPALLGGKRQRIGSSYALMCNERPRTLGALLKEAYCDAGHGSLPGCN